MAARSERKSASLPRHRGHGHDVCTLSQLATGSTAWLYATDLDGDTRDQLRGLGLTDRSLLRVCKRGDPCIIEVRRTRLGLSRTVADAILVVRHQPAVSGGAG